MNKTNKNIIAAAMFAALAFAVAALSNVVPIPLVPALPFLHYDAKDVIIALSGFILGPLYALGISLAVSLLELTISSTGPIGALMNFLSSAIFACIAALVYKYRRSIGGAVTGLALSSVLTTAFMLGWNYLISPLYMGISRAAISKMLIPAFLPFNAIKSTINSGITLILYKPVTGALRLAGLIGGSKGHGSSRISIISLVTGILLIALGIGLAFIIKHFS